MDLHVEINLVLPLLIVGCCSNWHVCVWWLVN